MRRRYRVVSKTSELIVFSSGGGCFSHFTDGVWPSCPDYIQHSFFSLLYTLNRPIIVFEDLVEHPELGLIKGSLLLLEGIVLIPGVILDRHQRLIAQPVAVLVDGLVEVLGELARNGLRPNVLNRETVGLVVDNLLHRPIKGIIGAHMPGVLLSTTG